MTALTDPELLDRRDRILDAVAIVSDLLMQDRPWRESLPEVLAVLGRASRVSRVYYFECRRSPEGGDLVSQVAEWVAEGVEPQIDNHQLQNLDLQAAGFGRWMSLLDAGQAVFGDIAEFPESERPLLEAQDIKSILVKPVATDSTLLGFIGFDACAETQSWSPLEVRVLRVAARLLGAEIHREHREDAWRQSERMAALGRMASGVAHDFNNLLTVVSATSQLARVALNGGDAARRSALSSLDTTDRAVVQSTALVRRLLDFGRGGGGHVERILVSSVLEEMRPLIRQAAGSAVEVDLRSVRDVAPIRIDPFQFRQVILNLAGNARDATPDGGRLEIEVSMLDRADRTWSDGPGGAWVVVTVHDSGTGVPESIRDRIFEPFFTTKPAEQGTGLGLAIVYRILRNAGGRIRLVEDGRRGTTFRIELPAAPASDAG